MSTALKGAIFRLLRVGASLALTSAISYLANDPRFVIAAPVINAVAKYIREKYTLPMIPF